MSKSGKIKHFIEGRIAQIDQEYQQEGDVVKRLTLSTQRISFANILSVYLNVEDELGVSYLKHANTYFAASCYEQAIFYAELAKKHVKDPLLNEEAAFIILNCLLRLDRVDEAHDLLKTIKPAQLKQQYYEIKAQVMEKLADEEQTDDSMQKLGEIILDKYTGHSPQMGLFLVEKGRKQGTFCKFVEALKNMHQGMNILIEVKYKNHIEISNIYLQMANFSRQLDDLDNQYTSLICAHSMIRQADNREKELVQTLHRIAANLTEREDNDGALRELLKIQALQKHIYGQSSLTVGRTLKNIADVLTKMNCRNESRKYEQEYNRIVCCNDRKGQNRQKPLRYSQIKCKNDHID